MATSKAKTAATWTTKAASEVGHAAYQVLHDSLDAAASAANALRADLDANGRDRLREIERLVREAQHDLRRSGEQLLAGLQSLAEQASTATTPATKRPAAPSARTTSGGRGSSRGATAKPKPRAARAAATKKAAVETTAAKKAASRSTAAKRTAQAKPAPTTAKRAKPAAAKAPAAKRAKPAAAKTPVAKRAGTAKPSRAKRS